MRWLEKHGFLSLVFVLTLLVVVAAAYSNINIKRNATAQVHDTLHAQLQQTAGFLRLRLGKAKDQLAFLAQTPPMQGIVRAMNNNGFDEQGNTTATQWKDRMATIFGAIINNYPEVMQVRFIDANDGLELVRVDKVQAGFKRVNEDDLQTKLHRDYMKESLLLKPGQTYVSDIDLNREYGEIVMPLQPTFRVTLPVFNDAQVLQAVLVINYDVTIALRALNQNLAEGVQILGIAHNNQFFAHPDSSKLYSRNVLQQGTEQDVLAHIEPIDEMVHLYHDNASKRDVFAVTEAINIGSQNSPMQLTIAAAYDASKFNRDVVKVWHQSLSVISLFYIIMLVLLYVYDYLNQRRMKLLQRMTEYKAVFQSINMPIINLNELHCIHNSNDAFGSFFQIDQMQCQNKCFYDVIPFTVEESGQIEAHLEQGQPYQFDTVIVDGHGTERHINVHVVPVIQSAEHSAKTSAILLYDQTQERALREELVSVNLGLEEKVAERTRELAHASELAQQASEAKSLFVANMSHELRTPMNGVFGMLNLISQEPLSQQQRQYLQMAQASASNLTQLINSVLDISKIEAGKIELEEQPLNIDMVLTELLQSNSIVPREKGLQLLLDTTELTQHCYFGDLTRVRQIFTNLVSNAVKFTERGYIQITVRDEIEQDHARLIFSVEDSGVGIESEKLGHLFDSFTQADNSVTRKYGGTGLGLAISKKLVELMGGTLAVKSEVGKGSCFYGELRLRTDAQVVPRLYPLQDLPVISALPDGRLHQLISKQLTLWGASVSHIREQDTMAQLKQQLAAEDRLVVAFDCADKQAVQWLDTELSVHKDSAALQLLAYNSSDDKVPAVVRAFANVQLLHSPVTAQSLSSLMQVEQLYYKEQESKANIDDKALAEYRGMNVLLVDDNQINQVVAQGSLKKMDLAITVRNDGQQALDELKQNHDYDLVIMDCQMPVLDGYAASLAIRRGEAGSHYSTIPIIAMTANAMAGDRERCLQSGMSDYVPKPIDADLLLEKVVYWLSVANTRVDAGNKHQRS